MSNINLNLYLYVIFCRLLVVFNPGLTISTSDYHGEMSGERINDLDLGGV